LPKALPHPSPLPVNMSQNMIQTLKSMSQAERQQVMSQWLMRQNFLRQQQQAVQSVNQQGPSFNPNMLVSTANQVNAASAVNMMGGGGPFQGNFAMNQNPQTQGGLSGSMTAGPLGSVMPMNHGAPSGGDINYELQSMMQRNAGNGMG